LGIDSSGFQNDLASGYYTNFCPISKAKEEADAKNRRRFLLESQFNSLQTRLLQPVAASHGTSAISGFPLARQDHAQCSRPSLT
jgi:hypothetical protein